MKDKLISILALLGSTGTLICCVLPAVIVTLVGGAALSTLLPWLIPLSKYKMVIFENIPVEHICFSRIKEGL